METVRELTYFGDRLIAGGGCDAAVTVRTGCGWDYFAEFGELLNGENVSSMAERSC